MHVPRGMVPLPRDEHVAGSPNLSHLVPLPYTVTLVKCSRHETSPALRLAVEPRFPSVRSSRLLATPRGSTAFFISSKEGVLPAANSRSARAMRSRNSGCVLRARDSRSTCFKGTIGATGLLRSVTTTMSSPNSLVYSASGREALESLMVFRALSPDQADLQSMPISARSISDQQVTVTGDPRAVNTESAPIQTMGVAHLALP